MFFKHDYIELKVKRWFIVIPAADNDELVSGPNSLWIRRHPEDLRKL